MEIRESYVKSKSFRTKRYDQDKYDRIFSVKMAGLFFVIAFTATLVQYVGSTIQCSLPPTLPAAWHRYINRLCWFNGTYFWPLEKPLADAMTYGNQKDDIYYYKYFSYFPIFYLIMAAFLILPDMFWRIMSNRSGIGLSSLLAAFDNSEKQFDTENAKKLVANVSFCLYRQSLIGKLYKNERYGRYYMMRKLNYLDSRTGNYLAFNFIIKKYLYIIAFILIFIYLNVVLNNKFWLLGLDFLHRVFQQIYEQSTIFPLFVLCDLRINYLSITSYTFQCIVTRNIFMDGFITMTWFILVIGIILAIYSAIRSSIELCHFPAKVNHVKKFLIDVGKIKRNNYNKNTKLSAEDGEALRKQYDRIELFVKVMINTDIVFITWMISKLNANADFTVQFIFKNLMINFDQFKEDFESKAKAFYRIGEKRVARIVEDSSSDSSTNFSQISSNYNKRNNGDDFFDEKDQFSY